MAKKTKTTHVLDRENLARLGRPIGAFGYCGRDLKQVPEKNVIGKRAAQNRAKKGTLDGVCKGCRKSLKI